MSKVTQPVRQGRVTEPPARMIDTESKLRALFHVLNPAHSDVVLSVSAIATREPGTYPGRRVGLQGQSDNAGERAFGRLMGMLETGAGDSAFFDGTELLFRSNECLEKAIARVAKQHGIDLSAPGAPVPSLEPAWKRPRSWFNGLPTRPRELDPDGVGRG